MGFNSEFKGLIHISLLIFKISFQAIGCSNNVRCSVSARNCMLSPVDVCDTYSSLFLAVTHLPAEVKASQRGIIFFFPKG